MPEQLCLRVCREVVQITGLAVVVAGIAAGTVLLEVDAAAPIMPRTHFVTYAAACGAIVWAGLALLLPCRLTRRGWALWVRLAVAAGAGLVCRSAGWVGLYLCATGSKGWSVAALSGVLAVAGALAPAVA